MNKGFKIISLIVLLTLFSSSLFASGKQSSQIVKQNHWIYNDLTYLAAETKTSAILETMPISVGEIRFFLNQIDYEQLSSNAKIVYQRIIDFLGDQQDFVKADEFRFYLNLIFNPELYYKSNEELSWSFIFNFKDYNLTMPVIIGYSDNITFQTDFYFGKNNYYATLPNNFTNLPLDYHEINFYFPDFSYFSGCLNFDKWGITSHMGHKGLKIGNTHMGSIIYNDTFETDFYSQLNFYCKYLKYSMDVVQVNKSKYYYLHQLTFRPIKNLNLGVMEGSLLNAPFELRYLNPFYVMHNYGAWVQYSNPAKKYYGESNFCAFLGLSFELIPIKNMRVYGLYAQNEMYNPGSIPTAENLSTPTSIGGQLGIEYYFSLPKNNTLATYLEAVYTSPYLYVKQSPDWSLFNDHYDYMHSASYLNSWMGFPEGPDCFAIKAGVNFIPKEKWSAGFEYNFRIHGENTADFLFNQTTKDADGIEYWNYYPYAKYVEGKLDNNQEKINKAVADSTNMWMHGIKEYKNEFILRGNYKIRDNFILDGQFIYTFCFNNKNIPNNFQQGVEIDFSLRYEIL